MRTILNIDGSSEAIQCQRSSAIVRAVGATWTQLTANEPYTLTMPPAPMLEPVIDTEHAYDDVWSYAPLTNAMYCRDNTGGKIYRTTDLVNYEEVCDFLNDPAMVAFRTAVNTSVPTFILELSPGVLLASMGRATYDGVGGVTAAIFRSIDGGATWSKVRETTKGAFLRLHAIGDHVCACEYATSVGDEGTGSRVHVSDDGGITWYIAVDPPDISAPPVGNVHCHGAYWLDDTTLYVEWGDGLASAQAVYKRSSATATDWAMAEDDQGRPLFRQGRIQLSSTCFVSDTLAYGVRETGIAEADLIRLNPRTLEMTPLVNLRISTADAVYQPQVIDGMVLFAVHKMGDDTAAGGLYLADPSGYNQVTRLVARAKGIRHLLAVNGRRVLGTLYSGSDQRLFYVDLPASLTSVTAVAAESARTNTFVPLAEDQQSGSWDYAQSDDRDCLFSVEAASVTNAPWTDPVGVLTAFDNPEYSTMPGLMRGVGASLKAINNDTSLAAGDRLVIMGQFYGTGYEMPQADLWASVTARAKAYFNTQTTTGMTLDPDDVWIIGEGWRPWRVKVVVDTPSSTVDSRRLQIDSQSNSVTDFVSGSGVFIPGLELRFTAFQAFNRQDRSNEPVGFVPYGTPAAADYSTVALPGLGTAWTVHVAWQAHTGEISDFPLVDGQADYLPIATLKDGAGGYIELRWDRRAYEDGGKRFYLTDGVTRIDLTLSAAQTWRRFDTLHFVIVGLAGSVALYCWAPENSETHGAAILSGQGDMSLTPVDLVLGANHDASVVGTGLYSRIGAWDAAASEDDIATLFAGDGILTSVEQLAEDQAAVAAAAGQFRGTILGVAGTQRKHIGPG